MKIKSKKIKKILISLLTAFSVVAVGRVAVAAEFFDKSRGIAGYIDSIFKYALGAAIFMAVAALVFGGISYMVSYGNPEKVNDAKEIIIAAISGLVVILISVMLLNVLDPRLTTLTNPATMELNTTPVEPGAQDVGGACEDSSDCKSYNCDQATNTCAPGTTGPGVACIDQQACPSGYKCDLYKSSSAEACCHNYGGSCDTDHCCSSYYDDVLMNFNCVGEKCCIQAGGNVHENYCSNFCCSGECDGFWTEKQCK